MVVKIDLAKCTGCFQCVLACPNGLFKVVEGKAQVDNSGCISCRVCSQSCDPGAISVITGKTHFGGGY